MRMNFASIRAPSLFIAFRLSLEPFSVTAKSAKSALPPTLISIFLIAGQGLWILGIVTLAFVDVGMLSSSVLSRARLETASEYWSVPALIFESTSSLAESLLLGMVSLFM